MPKREKIKDANYDYELFINARQQCLINAHFFSSQLDILQTYNQWLKLHVDALSDPELDQTKFDFFSKSLERMIGDFVRLFTLVRDEFYFCHWGVMFHPYQSSRANAFIYKEEDLVEYSNILIDQNGQRPRVLCSVVGLQNLVRSMVCCLVDWS
jgi:hypothetical protein